MGQGGASGMPPSAKSANLYFALRRQKRGKAGGQPISRWEIVGSTEEQDTNCTRRPDYYVGGGGFLRPGGVVR
jgi:hypothetical protein